MADPVKDNTLTTTTNQSGYIMTMREQVSLGISALNDIFSIFQNLSGGSDGYGFQAMINKQNAEVLRQDAKGILDYYNRQENIMREQGKRVRGEQRTAMGASGFDVGSKSFVKIVDETDRNILNNAMYIREEAMNKYASAMYKAKAEEIQGDLYKKTEKISKRAAIPNTLLAGISAAAKLGSAAYFGERG